MPLIRSFALKVHRILSLNVSYLSRNLSLDSASEISKKWDNYLDFCGTCDEQCRDQCINDMAVLNDFVTAEEEQSLLNEVEPYMQKLHYEFDHWDDAIHGYRETERLHWNEKNSIIIEKIRQAAFPSHVPQLKLVHVLDLSEKGMIKAHIDSVRFCGNIIAGLSLLTDSVMRLVHKDDKKLQVDVLLKRRSLYIMRGIVRYDYTHEILANQFSIFKGKAIPKFRRISIICRNEPDHDTII